ncbi:MAG: DUF6754 domain-containing protein [Candidatus Limnocylindria bacterium]
MPAEVVGDLVRLIGEVLGASSLRFDVGPTLVILGVLLVFLQLVARPVTRWVSSDAGNLGSVGRAMALAAESGTDAVLSLGTAGLTRSTDAFARLQTLAALPILGHVARAAARSGVPLRVLTNDPLAGVLADAALDAAHEQTATLERMSRSRVVMVGEGRPAAAGLVLTTRARPAASFAIGSLREEALLHLEGLGVYAGSLTAGTAEAAQAPSLMLTAAAPMIGPQPFQAPSDLRSSSEERTTVIAGNRLIGLAVGVIIIGTLIALTGVADPRELLLGARAG